MIRFDRVSFAYPGAAAPALRDVDLVVPEGELCLVVGRTGSGKSTLLRAVNGLVPHFSGGTLSGRVSVDGRDTRDHPPRELADVVGYVGQDPDAGFVTDTVEDELAYAMENLGLAPATMRRRVEDVLDLLGLAELRGRALPTLSAGQQQRVAVGSVLTAHPRVLVLDEPTSALDPPAAEEVLAALQRLVHDLGLTVLLAEHRLERVAQYADRVVLVDGTSVTSGTPREVLAYAPVAPPVVKLARLAGWEPVPLSVRDARRAAGALRELPSPDPAPAAAGEVVAATERLSARYGDLVALREVSLAFRAGEVVALMGRNGAGKTTLLAHLVGLRKPSHGRVLVAGRAPYGRSGREMARVVGLVPQDPGRLLYAETVAEECAAADREAGLPTGTTAGVLDRLAPWVPGDRHPSDLSEGERLALALAVVLGGEPPLLLLDEPTRGLDYAAKTRLVPILRGLAARGHAVVLSTHDVELAAELADRTVVMAEGEVVADGPAREVLRQSPAFAPQVNKVLGGGWLTVDEVAAALA
ncbi:MAG TPA: ATP-binding cassette domain-containing protein [Mycobacteriales bacterium]|nr:ATP-binding cassette domain-containing protein [Mycobacteriales bacterium]